jgi:hypothetical protein
MGPVDSVGLAARLELVDGVGLVGMVSPALAEPLELVELAGSVTVSVAPSELARAAGLATSPRRNCGTSSDKTVDTRSNSPAALPPEDSDCFCGGRGGGVSAMTSRFFLAFFFGAEAVFGGGGGVKSPGIDSTDFQSPKPGRQRRSPGRK